MNYLEKYGFNDDDFNYLKKHYNNKILSNIIYKQENIEKVIEELNNKDFDIKYLLLNRMDIFFIDIDDFKNKLNKYNKEELEQLKENFADFW